MKNIKLSIGKLVALFLFFLANTFAVYTFLGLSSCAHSKVATAPPSEIPKVSPLTLGSSDSTSAIVEQDPGVMSQVKQLTFAGARAGEGYFSADGTQMIFQSEREPGNPFYQIYSMDLKSGRTERLSPGSGKTTCAWFHPSMKKMLFSSTHNDSGIQKKVEEEYALRKSPQKNKYSWSFDEQFEIYEKDQTTGHLQNLTRTLGYDAEASYSPDGKWIVFASNRAAYIEKLPPEEAKLFQQDPSYLMDIYIMKADGSQVKQLTTVKGYDGGPFFSADGKKITWRRFAPNGQSAEIYTMNVDGSEQKAITHLKSMSWAPFFHPSGDYVVFTANKLGFSNFELFIVDSAGKKDPVRVSYRPDFDGLPVFSPDGGSLSWTHRDEKGESQIYLAHWDDRKARELLGLPRWDRRDLKLTDLQPEIRKQDIEAEIQYLASPNLAGRKTGSPQEKVYTEKIKELLQGMGLDVQIQPFEFTSGVNLGQTNTLTLNAGALAASVGSDFMPLSLSKTGDFPQGPLAFAGYGIVAPSTDKDPLFDSYKSIDVKGKWVLILRDIPEGIANNRRIHLNAFSRLQHKILVAKQRGAIGVLVASGPNSGSQQKLMKLRFEGAMAESTLPVVSVSDAIAEQLLKPTGRSLKQWQDVLDGGETQSTDVSGATVAAHLELQWERSKGHNVLAQILVKGATTSVVIGAHGDHLGRGEFGSSLARPDEKGEIHAGADDNASGVAGVLELAHYFSSQQRLGKLPIKQNLIFAIWSGEEIGLLGSSQWLEKNAKNLRAYSSYINMDMIGRYRDRLMVQGLGSAPEWKALFEELVPSTDLHLVLQEDPYLPSDSMAFYMKKIPGVMFFTGAHGEYHSPRDLPELINSEAEVKILHLVKNLIEKLTLEKSAGQKLRTITYQKAESSRGPLEGRSFRVYLGTIPDYAQEGIKGVKISGTSKGSPSEKAGLLPGDVIVELSGLKIENLYDYVYGLQSLKAGQETRVKIQRSGQLEEFSITPSLKE